MGFGAKLKEEAQKAPDKMASGDSGAWSIVFSAPGFMRGAINENWFTVRHRRASEPTAENWAHLRSLIRDAGGNAEAEPEHPDVRTLRWRWPPAEGDDTLPSAQELDPHAKVHIDPDAPPDVTAFGKKIGRNPDERRFFEELWAPFRAMALKAFNEAVLRARIEDAEVDAAKAAPENN